MTSNQYQHVLVHSKPVQCPNLSVLGHHCCHHCGDNNGMNAQFKATLQLQINQFLKPAPQPNTTYLAESQSNAFVAERPVQNNACTTERSVQNNPVQTIAPQITTHPIAPAINPGVVLSETPKVKARGRPPLNKSAPPRNLSLAPKPYSAKKSVNVNGPPSANRQPMPPFPYDLHFNGPFRFLHLPHNVRRIVYIKLLMGLGALQKHKDPTGNRPYHQPPITRINREIRNESLPLLYSMNPFWAENRDLCKSGPAFAQAIGEANFRLINLFNWYTAKRTVEIRFDCDGITSNVRGEGPNGDERAQEICRYLNERVVDHHLEKPFGLGLFDLNAITAIVLRAATKK